jgi:hypothetical protein
MSDEAADITSDGAVGSDHPIPALARVRSDPRSRWVVVLSAMAVGLALAWFHWLGLIVGAALVAIPQRSLPRGLIAGLGFGVIAFLAHVLVLATTGPAVLDTAVAMQQVFGVSGAVAVVAGVVGGLVRGVV